jgi:hypothetical protein
VKQRLLELVLGYRVVFAIGPQLGRGIRQRKLCAAVSGFVILWQTSQPTASSTSASVRAEASVGVEFPASQPAMVWQRIHRSPEPSKSCSAIATVAQ